MNPEDLLKQGALGEALVALKQQVAAKPGDARLRWFLFQLFCFAGDWARAKDQLSLAAQLDSEFRSSAMIYGRLLAAEGMRQDILLGKRTPLFLGEPCAWVARILEANKLLSDGQQEASSELRANAFEEMPAVAGRINGQDFSWICDQDTRIGAQLECFFHGKYYWLPFDQIQTLSMESAPKSHTDVLYPQARLTLRNQGSLDVLLFARYALSSASCKDALLLNRLTEWEDPDDLTVLGSGQRTFCTDQGEYPVLEVRALEFD
jgi:type VI secretion system protein ImpE